MVFFLRPIHKNIIKEGHICPGGNDFILEEKANDEMA